MNALFPVWLFASALVVDPAAHTVEFDALANGLSTTAPLEFLFCGPGSDKDYESLYSLEVSVGEFVQALEAAGIPRGQPTDSAACRFWPVGVRLELNPRLETLLRDTREKALPPLIYTGGTRLADGSPAAATNMPLAAFSLYTLAQSPLQFGEALDQGATYGRFVPARALVKGERCRFKLTWRGAVDCRHERLVLSPGNAAAALKRLKALPAAELEVAAEFDGALTVAEAARVATALEALDSPAFKLNGTPNGSFYYRAFLPQERWRNRRDRLLQPPELHFAADGQIEAVLITEIWSNKEIAEPELKVEARTFASAAEAARWVAPASKTTKSALLFAPVDTRLAPLYALNRALAADVVNYYVFGE